MSERHVETVIIGGGQAGLAVGYHLRQRGLPFVMLDENDRIGEAWRARWDSLRLFTPARYSGLPGMPFPAARSVYPTKDETAAYLEAYAQQFGLPVRNGVKVDGLSASEGRFRVACGGDIVSADNVVVAIGAYHHPRVPPFAAQLSPESSSSTRPSTATQPSSRRGTCWWWGPATPEPRSPLTWPTSTESGCPARTPARNPPAPEPFPIA